MQIYGKFNFLVRLLPLSASCMAILQYNIYIYNSVVCLFFNEILFETYDLILKVLTEIQMFAFFYFSVF